MSSDRSIPLGGEELAREEVALVHNLSTHLWRQSIIVSTVCHLVRLVHDMWAGLERTSDVWDLLEQLHQCQLPYDLVLQLLSGISPSR
jgi:hypothetical protein